MKGKSEISDCANMKWQRNYLCASGHQFWDFKARFSFWFQFYSFQHISSRSFEYHCSKVMFKLKASGNLSFEDSPDVISAISLGFCLCAAIHGTKNKDGTNVRG